MPELILPDRVRYQLQFDQQLEQMNKRHSWLRHFDAELRAIDPYLSLVKASEAADQPGLVPGFWHVKRDNPTTMPTFVPLRDQDGGFAEPSFHHLEMLRRLDMQRPGAFDEFKRRQDELAQQAERRREAEAEERRDEMAERIASKERASVSMTEGWKNSVRGKRDA